jgi:phage anti-repressor protein
MYVIFLLQSKKKGKTVQNISEYIYEQHMSEQKFWENIVYIRICHRENTRKNIEKFPREM